MFHQVPFPISFSLSTLGTENNLLFDSTNLKTKKITWNVKIPQLIILGQYKINGKFLVLPIRGEGPANITLGEYTIILYIYNVYNSTSIFF
jgi:hypothetical protein